MKQFGWIGSALMEFLINFVVSTIPFSLALLTLTVSSSLNMGFEAALHRIASNGEMVIYSATLMAPILYAVVKEPPVAFRRLFIVLGLLVVVMGAGTYVIGMLDGFGEKIVVFSYLCFVFSVLVFLAVLLVQHQLTARENAPKIQANKMRDTLQEYEKRRGINS